MATQPEKQGEIQQETPEDRAVRQAEGIRGDYAYRDKWAMQEAEGDPSVEAYIKDLQAKSSGETLEALRKAIMAGEDKSTDIEVKVKIETLLDKARNILHHALVQPETPSRVKAAQAALENAVSNLERRHIAPTERMQKLLAGELSVKDIDPMSVSMDEFGRLKAAAETAANLPPEELSKLQDEISAALERLNAEEPQIAKIAETKALPQDKKEETLKLYEDMYKRYQEQQADLKHILDQLGKKK